jgi:hypothetical protein
LGFGHLLTLPDFFVSLLLFKQSLISEIQLDVEAQLKVRLDEYETFEKEREFLPGRTKTVKEAFNEDLKKLSEELRRAGFTPPMLESVQFHLESQLERLTERNLANSYGNRLKEQLNTLRKQQFEAGNVLVDDGSEALDLGLTSPNPQATLLKAPKAKKRTFQPMDALPEAIAAPLRRLQNVLGDYHENRETLNRRFAPAIEVSRLKPGAKKSPPSSCGRQTLRGFAKSLRPRPPT